MSILGETFDYLLGRKPRPVRAIHQNASVSRAASHLSKPLQHSSANGRGTLFLSPPTMPSARRPTQHHETGPEQPRGSAGAHRKPLRYYGDE